MRARFALPKIENLPGFRARTVYVFVSSDEIQETFWLAPPGSELALYTEATLKRVR